MRIIVADATCAEVLRQLKYEGRSDREAIRMTCHAIAHGFYKGRRVILDYDAVAENFLLVIKR